MKYLLIVLSILFSAQICSAGTVAINPNPANQMIDVDVTSTLTWENTNQAEFVNVYLNESTFPIELVVNHLYTTSYAFENLNYDTTYVWRVDSIDRHDNIISGDTWEFTTQVPELPTVVLLSFVVFLFYPRR